jgi:hypothetical protein
MNLVVASTPWIFKFKTMLEASNKTDNLSGRRERTRGA